MKEGKSLNFIPGDSISTTIDQIRTNISYPLSVRKLADFSVTWPAGLLFLMDVWLSVPMHC